MNRRDLIAASGTGVAAVLLSSAGIVPSQAHASQASSPESDFIIDQAMQHGWWGGNTRAMVDQVAQSGLEASSIGALAANDSVTEATYDYFPFTTPASRPWFSAKTANNSYQTPLEFFWGDRATGPAPGVKTAWNLRGNDISGVIFNSAGVECRVEYDTYEKATAATV